MTNRRRYATLAWFGLVLALGLAARAMAQPVASVWDAASGLSPEQVCPAWTLVDTAPGANPVLANGELTLATTAADQDMYYVQLGLDVPLPDPIVVEARLRFVSGSSMLQSRGPAAIAITTAANSGILFFVGPDEIFVTAAGDVRGQSATVDTDGAAHTYRIEVTAAGAVTVSYDGTPTLTGATYTSVPAFGPVTRILWGEGSINAFGTHVWTAFRHNALTCASGTTTTTTKPTGSTTTSTTLPSTTCDDVEPGSLDALRCRLDVLADEIAGKHALGPLQSKLAATLARAISLAGDASDSCASGDAKTASRRMKQTQKLLQKMAHRLAGLPARKRLDPTVRTSVITTITGTRTDAGALRKQPCGT